MTDTSLHNNLEVLSKQKRYDNDPHIFFNFLNSWTGGGERDDREWGQCCGGGGGNIVLFQLNDKKYLIHNITSKTKR